LPDLATCNASQLPRPLGKVQSVAAAATAVRGGPQFSVATPVARDATSSRLGEELLLGEGSTRPARAVASMALGTWC
jgi:hypothetical protein